MEIDKKLADKVSVSTGDMATKAIGLELSNWVLTVALGTPVAWVLMLALGNMHHRWPAWPAPGYLSVWVLVVATRAVCQWLGIKK